MPELRFEHRKYSLAFRRPLRTAAGVWQRREGLIVRLADADGKIGWGEAAPVPAFGMETIDELAAAAASLGDKLRPDAIASIPARFPTLANALRAAMQPWVAKRASAVGGEAASSLPLMVAALIPAGKGALSATPPLIEAGFRTFKWKVGVGDWRDETGLLDELLSLLPEGAKLRLDANGSWDRRTAERWLDRCSERPIEFVEQPVGEGEHYTRPKADDVLLGLAADFPTPIALDEVILGEGDLERWIGGGWPGYYVIKPTLFADPEAALERLAKAKAEVIFSSAIETAIGAAAALRLAFRWSGTRRAVGFGVWPIFEDGRFDGPHLAPFVRLSDVDRTDPESLWTALS